MAFLDPPANPDPRTPAQIAADRVKQIMRQSLEHIRGSLDQLRDVVQRGGGKAAVAAELGADAAALQTLYDDLKNIADQHPDITVDPF